MLSLTQRQNWQCSNKSVTRTPMLPVVIEFKADLWMPLTNPLWLKIAPLLNEVVAAYAIAAALTPDVIDGS